MKRLKMGIIGAGMAFERLHYPAYLELKDRFEIAAISDPDIKKLEHWKGVLGLRGNDIYTDYHELINRNDLDAFDIMVPIGLNFKITEEIAAKRKPIICEKPLGANLKEIKKARSLPKKYWIPIMFAENYRYNEENNLIRDLLRNGEIGRVFYFIQNRIVNFPDDMRKNEFAATEWRQYPNYPGGVILDTVIHDIAALRHIFGGIESVQAFGNPQEENYSPYSVIQVNLLFKSGMSGHFSFFSSGIEMQRPLIGLRIFSSKGMIFLEERDCGIINIAYNSGESKQLPYQPRRGFYNELLNFYKAASGKEALSVTPEMEFGDALTIFAILKSARKMKIVEVDEIADYEYKPILH